MGNEVKINHSFLNLTINLLAINPKPFNHNKQFLTFVIHNSEF